MEIPPPPDYESLTTLDISNKGLIELPSWVSECKNLEIFKCSFNEITHLDNLPQTLKILECCDNNITQLDNLPLGLIKLYCINNPLKYDFEPTLENIRNYINQNTKNKLIK